MIQKWIEALRSGEFQQTRLILRDTHGYCCLGVLTELYRTETKQGIWVKEKKLFQFLTVDGESYESILPLEVKKCINIPQSSGKVDLPHLKDRNGCITSLAHLKDQGFTFNQIADIIEWYFAEELK